MQFLRGVFLALALVAVVPAPVLCCIEPVEAECCGDLSDCPTGASGECVRLPDPAPGLSTDVAPMLPTLDAILVPVHTFHRPAARAVPALSRAAHPPANPVPGRLPLRI
jgi:hypothetical protein